MQTSTSACEDALVTFIRTATVASTPEHVVDVVRQVLITVSGTSVAGAHQDGIGELRAFLVDQGGRAEALSLVFGDALPARSAAMLNGAMARALDYCDAMVPGLHLGSAVVPAALATAALVPACSGENLLEALIVGLEVGSRLNLPEEVYDGFDPTGIAGLMGATAAVARLLDLSDEQTAQAMALAFNRCGGSFQSNIDGSLAVRLIEGWVASMAVECGQLAAAGLTGPRHFLSGTYGYSHLFGRGRVAPDRFVEDLGGQWHLLKMVFKKYPSCGLTQGVTELAVQALEEGGVDPADITGVEVFVPPYSWRLVGQPFEAGTTPRVNAQFSAQYCVASALERRGAVLRDFEPSAVRQLVDTALFGRVQTFQDPALDAVSHTACRLVVHTPTTTWTRELAIAPGFPGNDLDEEAHLARFLDCWDYAGLSERSQGEMLRETVAGLEHLASVGPLTELLIG